MTPQERIYEAVEARGYVAPYAPEVFIARQIVKLTEELGEAWLHLDVSLTATWETEALQGAMEAVRLLARRVFSDPEAWGRGRISLNDVRPKGLAYLRGEAADMAVVLNCLAEAISRLDATPFSLDQTALDKSQADIARGVRKEQA